MGSILSLSHALDLEQSFATIFQMLILAELYLSKVLKDLGSESVCKQDSRSVVNTKRKCHFYSLKEVTNL